MIKIGCDESLPIGWNWCAAQDVIDIRDGTHDSPKYQASGIPLVTSKNLVEGRINFSTCQFISEADHVKISKRSFVSDGDILYAMIGTIGNPVIVQKEFEFSIKNVALFKFDKELVDNSFLYHYLNSDLTERQFKKDSRGGTQKFVSLGNIRKLQIPLPPLKEQKRIAAILDKADTIRRKRQQAIELADQFLRSVFLDMFGDPTANSKGWKVKPLSYCLSGLEGGKNVKPAEAETKTRNRILKVSAVTSGFFKENESKPLPDDFTPPKTFFVRKGDLLISRANTSELIGATALVDYDPVNIILPDKIWRFLWRSNREVSPAFFHYLFKQKHIRREISIRSSGTSGSMKNIPKSKLLEIMVPIPPINLQEKFEQNYLLINNLKKILLNSAFKYDRLFSSLSQRAFNGNLIQSKAA